MYFSRLHRDIKVNGEWTGRTHNKQMSQGGHSEYLCLGEGGWGMHEESSSVYLRFPDKVHSRKSTRKAYRKPNRVLCTHARGCDCSGRAVWNALTVGGSEDGGELCFTGSVPLNFLSSTYVTFFSSRHLLKNKNKELMELTLASEEMRLF